MRKFLIPAILGAVVASSGLAMAADKPAALTETGIVKTWNLKDHTLTLADGTMYILPNTFSTDKAFTVGEKVKISYVIDAGKKMASEAVMVK